MYSSKKSLGPVVATGLFIVVAVVATISFQVWFQDYSSQVFSDIEAGGSSLDTQIREIDGNSLYVSSGDIDIEGIYLNGETCNFNESLERGINQISLLDCLEAGTQGNVEVMIQTSEGNIQNEVYLGERDESSPEINNFNYHFGDNIFGINYYGSLYDYTDLNCQIGSRIFDCSSREFNESFSYEKEDYDGLLEKSLELENEYENIVSQDLLLSEGVYKNFEEEGLSQYILNKNLDDNGGLSPKENYGLFLDGEDAYVNLSPSSIPEGKEMTFSLWIYGYEEEFETETSLIEGTKDDGKRYFNVHFTWDNSDIYFDLGRSDGEYERIRKSVSSDEYLGWNLWTFTKNASSCEMKIYRNENLWHEGDDKCAEIEYVDELNLGRGAGLDYKRERFQKATLDDIRVYNRSLSQEDIEKLYNNRYNNIGYEDNLVSWWRVNQGEGNILKDSSTNENHGEIIRGQWEKVFPKGKLISHLDLSQLEKIRDSYINWSESKKVNEIIAFEDTGSHTWEIPEDVDEVEVLVVGGGGGGGAGASSDSSDHGGGGGGAGELIFQKDYSLGDQDIVDIYVGDGGSGVMGGSSSTGEKGERSQFGNLEALGGGGGASRDDGDMLGEDGGSGGGGTFRETLGGDSLAQHYGNSGGIGSDGGSRTIVDSGGGGGAGEPGSDAQDPGSDCDDNYGTYEEGDGEGGDGLYFGHIFGENYGENGWFAGGGGGGHGTCADNPFLIEGGLGGGGLGGIWEGGEISGYSRQSGEDAMEGTGGGGGGGPSNRYRSPLNSGQAKGGGDGGSGIVLIRYKQPIEDSIEDKVNISYQLSKNLSDLDNLNWESIDDKGSLDDLKGSQVEENVNFITKIEMGRDKHEIPILEDLLKVFFNDVE